MKTNYHTHCSWCDGKDTPERIVESAIAKGFDELGFSSHAMFPRQDIDWVLSPQRAVRYAKEIRDLAEKNKDRIKIRCGVEADYLPNGVVPDRAAYQAFAPDYIIGSVHFVLAPDGAEVPVDHTPQLLKEGVERHFGGDIKPLIRAFFQQQRQMVKEFDFDIVGHPDLIRKFNAKGEFFDERAPWYREELEETADAIAASGKVVEVNTGAISRGWLDDAYPSEELRGLLRERGVRFVLSSDAHRADALDAAFDRFGESEDYISFSQFATMAAKRQMPEKFIKLFANF